MRTNGTLLLHLRFARSQILFPLLAVFLKPVVEGVGKVPLGRVPDLLFGRHPAGSVPIAKVVLSVLIEGVFLEQLNGYLDIGVGDLT